MLSLPDSLLDHAHRLLNGSPTTTDVRRSISATYYAVFHRLTIDAAEQIGAGSAAALPDLIRRSAEHRSVRRVCEAIGAGPSARSKPLDALLVGPTPPGLTSVAKAFIELQDARIAADYVLEHDPSLTQAQGCLLLAEDALARWAAIRTGMESRTFLVAVIMHDRWTRRG